MKIAHRFSQSLYLKKVRIVACLGNVEAYFGAIIIFG